MRVLLSIVVLACASVGCAKKSAKNTAPDTPAPAPAPAPSGGNSVGIVPAGGVGIVTNPGGGGGSGGAVQAVRKAARRTQALNELSNLGSFIEQMRDPLGKMPTKDQILAELGRSAPNIKKGIEEGAYILTGTPDGGGLWAYEVDADKTPGIAVIGGRATRSQPEDVKRYLQN